MSIFSLSNLFIESTMKIVMISNFMNHHQIMICKTLQENSQSFIFYEYEEIPKERIELGYENYRRNYSFVRRIKDYAFEQVEKEIFEADLLILGGTNIDKKLLKRRIKHNKKIFRYSERIFKTDTRKNLLKKIYYKFRLRGESKKSNTFLLCSGSNVSSDYKKIKLYKNKMLKWGYFPVVNQEVSFIKKTLNNKVKILWVGRFLEWKNPIIAIETLYQLMENNIEAELYMVGDGPMYQELINYSKKMNLSDNVIFVGSMKHYEVKKYYMMCDIFLFTSSKQEGWGAVLNEALSYGLITISSSEAGATNYLIKDTYNGFIYSSVQNGSNQIYSIIKKVLNMSGEELRDMRMNAFNTVNIEWSAEIAGLRLLKFCKTNKKEVQGPMSDA